MLSLVQMLQNRSRYFFVLLALLGVANGACQVCILYLINKTISFQPLPYFQEYNYLLFFGVLAISFVLTLVFQRHLIRLANELAYEFTFQIFEKIREASVERIRSTGNEKIYTAMSDIDVISGFPVNFISVLNSFVVVICGILYLFFESVAGTLILLATMTVLSVFYIARNVKIERDMNVLRNLENDFYKQVNDLLSGLRELAMSSDRKENFYSMYVHANRKKARDLRISTSILYLSNNLSGTYSWYVVVGILLFGLSRISEVGVAGAVTFTFILLYIMGPIVTLIQLLPIFTRSKIAQERLTDFLQHLGTIETVERKHEQTFPEFQSLTFEGISFRYSDNADSFNVGPVDMTIAKNEMIFVTGGNGSGKSTFIHLLSGLIQPHAGQIMVNGMSVDTASANYRDQFSMIFTDPHLFSRNYENYRYEEVRDALDASSRMLRMEQVLKVSYEQDTIDGNLSKGQQKRLALMLAMLEQRPIMVMDEWAAEQDPEFRRYFYEEVLPALKAQGKTLIVVTHDDRYFHHADRVLKFNHGKMLETLETIS